MVFRCFLLPEMEEKTLFRMIIIATAFKCINHVIYQVSPCNLKKKCDLNTALFFSFQGPTIINGRRANVRHKKSGL